MAEKSPQELSEKQLAELEQKKKDYVSTYSTAEGKRVLQDLEAICFMNRTTFSVKEGRTLLNEGMRFVVVHIKNMMIMDVAKLRKLTEKGD